MVYFQTKNTNLGKFLSGLRFENVDIFYGHLEYFTDNGEILRPYGTFCVDLVHHVPRKIWQPCPAKRGRLLLN
jgi:hypothetical protein